MQVILWTLLLAIVSADCNTGCSSYCKDDVLCSQSCETNTICSQLCETECSSNVSVLDPYYNMTVVANLHDDYPITGCDASQVAPFTTLYCSTLLGRVYRLDIRTNKLEVLHNMPESRLFTKDGCGLYDITLSEDFELNSLLYLYHAKEDTRPGIHHVNAISEYRLQDDKLVFQGVVRVYVHHTTVTHAWMKMSMKRYVMQGPAELLVSNPGNPYHDVTLRRRMPHLSAISTFFVNPKNAEKNVIFTSSIADRTWASGVGDPISCTRSQYKADNVMCLSTIGGQRVVFEIKRAGEYSCQGKVCEEKTFANLTAGCPVESVVYYTGEGSLKPSRLMSSAACFVDGKFQAAQVLKLYEPNAGRLWETVPLRYVTPDGLPLMLQNTTILTADRFSMTYLAGYSMRDNSYFIYAMNRLKRVY